MICYNIWNFDDKPIGLYGIMLLIFLPGGYGVIRTAHKKTNRSRRMKRLEHARLPIPKKSEKLIQDCNDLAGRRPLDRHGMLVDASSSVRHIDSIYAVGGAS